MTILRFVNGTPVEINLTYEEMKDVYKEVRLRRDKANILYALEESADTNVYQVLYENLKSSDKLLTEVAMEFRFAIDKAGTGEKELERIVDAYQVVVTNLMNN